MLQRLSHIVILGLSYLLVSCNSVPKNHGDDTVKPNILLIHVDDLGYHDISCNGSDIYQTPNIDKLANESVVFNNAYANYPRCVPSRYSMMTGLYPIQNGDVPDDGFVLGNISEDRNFIKLLNKANYQTAYFGKWHLGSDKHSPTGFGYNYSYAAGKAGSPISYIYPFNTPKGTNKNVKKAPIADIEEDSKEVRYFSRNLMCPTSGISYPNPEPNNFSFNSPKGACPDCSGIGTLYKVNAAKIIPDDSLSIKNGGLAPQGNQKDSWIFKQLELIAQRYKFKLTDPISKISKEALDIILYGGKK